jgi:hypothetical protein
MRRTGRQSEATSRAIGDLIRAGLLKVRADDGRVLDLASERQRYGGRMWFCVVAAAPDRPDRRSSPQDLWKTCSESEGRKANTTK